MVSFPLGAFSTDKKFVIPKPSPPSRSEKMYEPPSSILNKIPNPIKHKNFNSDLDKETPIILSNEDVSFLIDRAEVTLEDKDGYE
jgi:hypothetical protein